MKSLTYLMVDLGCLFIPLLASFYPGYPFYKQWRRFLGANLIVAALFLVWDCYFTHLGVWGFNPDYVMGLYLFNLPVEEVLFFICIPYACVFSHYALNQLLKRNPLVGVHRHITVFLSITLVVVASCYIDRWYTAVSFFSMAAYLLFCLKSKRDLSGLYLTYLVTLPFFFIANGVLTGTGLEHPVVWYNNAENMGIRLGTIPLEDTMYGLLLIALNIHLQESYPSKTPIGEAV